MAWINVPGVNQYLPQASRDNNAWEVYNYFHNLSQAWTVESIAAMAGNMDVESTLNPGIENTAGAYGLTQYLGSRKTTFVSWMTSHGYSSWTDGAGQCEYINYSMTHNTETEAWYGRGGYTNSFSDFAYNIGSWGLYDLVDMFQYCFERVDIGNPSTQRRTRAAHYLEMYGGTPPGPTPGNVPAWLLYKFKGGNTHGHSTILL